MHTSLLMQPHKDRLLYFTVSSCYQTVEGKIIPLFDEKPTGAENLPHGGLTDSWPLFAFTVFVLLVERKSLSLPWNPINFETITHCFCFHFWSLTHDLESAVLQLFLHCSSEKFNYIDGTKCFNMYEMNIFSDHTVPGRYQV